MTGRPAGAGWLLAGGASLAAGIVLHLGATPQPDPDPEPAPEPTPIAVAPETVLTGAPMRLVVPRLGVDAAVVRVVSRERVLSPPTDAKLVGWWAQGPRPGATTGTAVVTAHTVHTGGGVFDRLGDLRPGDRLVVVLKHGRLRYVVTTVRDLGKAELAAEAGRLFQRTGPSRLLLVTCSDWNGREYLSNTVVLALPAKPGSSG